MSQHYTNAVDGFEIRSTNPACGKVAFSGERIIVEDVTTDPLWERPCAAAQHYRLLVIPDPLSRRQNPGHHRNLLRQPPEPRQEDIDAVELLTQTAALIIEHHKATEERAVAHERLRRSESRLRLALAGARAGAWEWDAATDDIAWSPEMFAISRRRPASKPI
jgi:PAS domain-containing protein